MEDFEQIITTLKGTLARANKLADKIGLDKIVRSYGNLSFDGNKLSGVASVFYNPSDPGTELNLLDNLWERVDRKAFDKTLGSNKEVIATFNHMPENILARTPNTLRLWTDEAGLHYEIDLPETRVAQDLKELIRRGDVKGSSFMGRVRKSQFQRDGDKEVRLLTEIDLIELGPVPLPAYGSTNDRLNLRSNELLDIQHDWTSWKETEKRLQKMEAILTTINQPL